MKASLFSPMMLFLASIRHSHGFCNKPFFKGLESILVPNVYRMQTAAFSSKRRKLTDTFDIEGLLEPVQKKRVIKSFQPKTENQIKFVELMRNADIDIVIAIGPAGTGKTMLACYAGVESLRLGVVHKIVITRPVVSVDEEIGFLPGGLESKMDPWTRPIFDSLRETYSAKEIERMMDEGIIEIVPLGFMRGRTFKNAWIIADEMQNSSPTQMFMLATRIGEGSKMIITGDLNQSDRDIYDNGLREIYDKVRRIPETDCVRYVELEKEDVQRSRAAKRILDIYSSETEVKEPESETPSISEISMDIDALDFDESVNGYHEFSSEPSPKEWVQEFPEFGVSAINDDAALIPLKHMNQLKGKLI